MAHVPGNLRTDGSQISVAMTAPIMTAALRGICVRRDLLTSALRTLGRYGGHLASLSPEQEEWVRPCILRDGNG